MRASELRAWHLRSFGVLGAVATLAVITSAVTHELDVVEVVCWAVGLVVGAVVCWRFRALNDSRLLLIWPVGVIATLSGSWLVTPQAARLNLGDIAIAFLLIGLSQRRWMSLPFLVPAVALYWAIQHLPTSQMLIRLVIAGFVWVCTAEIPAALAGGLRRMRQELAVQATTDELTALPNRRHWEEVLSAQLGQALRSGEPLTVMMVDLDHFKEFNDAHGHLRGDDLLRDFAGSLRALLRPGDMVARWGGEEFALALPRCRVDDAQRIAERILQAVPAGQSCSIGLASYRQGDSARMLVQRADVALYDAKHRGRNQVVRASRSA